MKSINRHNGVECHGRTRALQQMTFFDHLIRARKQRWRTGIRDSPPACGDALFHRPPPSLSAPALVGEDVRRYATTGCAGLGYVPKPRSAGENCSRRPLGDGHIVELRTMGPRRARSHPKGTPSRHCNPANGYALNGEPSLQANHGSSEMSFVNSASDQALAVLMRTFPNEAVASANLATLSPLEDSTMMRRSCSPEVR